METRNAKTTAKSDEYCTPIPNHCYTVLGTQGSGVMRMEIAIAAFFILLVLCIVCLYQLAKPRKRNKKQ